MDKYIYREVIITKNETWQIPEAKDQAFEVKVWGGGGSGSCDGNFYNPVSGAGGGSGHMNSGTFTIPAGSRVDIEIGEGGRGAYGNTASDFDGQMIGQAGGITRFGNYVFASGGDGGYRSIGGKGGHNGGNSGLNAEGGHGGFGVNGNVNGVSYYSGGGGAGVDACGRGGSANTALGDGGTAAGGAGCMVVSVNNAGTFRRIGSGGPGMCIIKYYHKI